MPEGIQTLSDAFADALAEAGRTDPAAVAPRLSGDSTNALTPGEQAPVVVQDQPDADTAVQLDDELAALMLETPEQDQSPSGLVPGSPEFLAAQVEVPLPDGPQAVSVNELVQGYMRQADYTKKTQEAADLRRQLQDADEFYNQFLSDPPGFAKALAVEAGWLQEGASPINPLPDVARIKSREELNAEIERRVEERLTNDPRIKQAQLAEAERTVAASFDQLEKKHGVRITQELRQSIVNEAVQRKTSDIELVFMARLARAQTARKQSGQLAANAPLRPGTPRAEATAETVTSTKPKTVQEAALQAIAEAQARQ